MRALFPRDVAVGRPRPLRSLSGGELHVSAVHARAAPGRDPVRGPAEHDRVAGRRGRASGRVRRGWRRGGVRVPEEAPQAAAVQMRKGER